MLKKIAPPLLALALLLCACGSDRTVDLTPSNSGTLSAVEVLSQDFLNSAYGRMNTSSLAKQLAELDPDDLHIQLDTDAKRMAFWVNVYNAFIQMELQKDSSLYANRDAFFKNRNKTVAGYTLSYNDIEHGILRRNKGLYSLGYFNKLKRAEVVRFNKVDRLDWRIHFALNCGARSCPPVAFYRSDQLNTQFNSATLHYLKREIDRSENKPAIPKLFLWFRADFGGPKGITKILQKFGGLEVSQARDWTYKPYDWSVDLNQWYAPGELINP